LRVLLDTHVLLWSIDEPEKIGPAAQLAFRTEVSQVVVSVISLWEIAIKQRLGHLTAPEDLPQIVQDLGHEILDVRADHAWHVRTLPRHHGDPFDRLLVAQAQIEDIPLITHDRILERYDIKVIRA
jgi:PIN domain nuclease of toxin-antitoxin system